MNAAQSMRPGAWARRDTPCARTPPCTRTHQSTRTLVYTASHIHRPSSLYTGSPLCSQPLTMHTDTLPQTSAQTPGAQGAHILASSSRGHHCAQLSQASTGVQPNRDTGTQEHTPARLAHTATRGPTRLGDQAQPELGLQDTPRLGPQSRAPRAPFLPAAEGTGLAAPGWGRPWVGTVRSCVALTRPLPSLALLTPIVKGWL